MSMVMGRRGRRPVLQLDDVSSSHQPRHQGFQPPQNGEKKREPASNPLLSLVGQYYSDSSSDEEDNDRPGEDVPEERGAEEEVAKQQAKGAEAKEDEKEAEKEVEGKKEEEKETEIPLPVVTEMFKAPEVPAPKPLQEIPLPEPSGELGSSLDSEVASFLAEIESISVEPSQDGKAGADHTVTADSSQPIEPDLGFIPRPDASIPVAPEEKKDHKPAPFAEEKRIKPSSSVNAYKSMFVKGASEFVQKEKEEEKRNSEVEKEEELPEEPVSEWQMVQDDATQYYYYWNLVTNEVTWEIPPGYTQFLLLYKEYEERIAKIPKDKLQRMKERKERKKQDAEAKRESSPAPSSSEPKSKSSKHKKEKHRKETVETVSSHVEIGPQLPSLPPETTSNNAKAASVKTEEETDKTNAPVSSKIPVGESSEVKASMGPDSAVDSTSVLADVEAIFDAALSAMAEGSANSPKPAVPVVTSSSAETATPGSIIDVARPSASAESSKPSSSVESSKSGSPVAIDTDPTTTTTAAVSAAVVSSSSVMRASPVLEKDSKDSENGEAVVTNSGVNDDAADDDDDDFDMDFDDIDDLDRALEKALEKKLEKKKAELEKLEQKQVEDGVSDSILPPSSPRSAPSQSQTSSAAMKVPAASALSPSEPESAVSSSVRTTPELTDTAPQPSKKSAVSSASSCVSGAGEGAESSGVAKSKRCAAESFRKEDRTEKQEPTVKKARLVAYDAPETDEESMDTSDEVSTTPTKATKPCSDSVHTGDSLPTPAPKATSILAEVQEMTDTAFAKLAFLDVTSDSLSPLQISLIQLQTRLTDWQEGGLVGEYFYQCLREVDAMLKKYESSAVPSGWTCQWDSNFRRYFYINTHTGESQWDYPEGNAVDSSSSGGKKMRKVRGSKKKVKAMGPEPGIIPVVEATLAVSTGVAMSQSGVEEDLDGVAMADDDVGNLEQPNGESTDAQPTTSSVAPESGDGIPSALQALFPGEPLPPGTELLLGLPPPPPPPLPADDIPSTTDDAYVCTEDSSDESGTKDDDRHEPKAEVQTIDPEIDGEEMVEEEEGGGEEVPLVVDDPAVISRPPQLRFPVVSSSASLLSAPSSSSLSVPAMAGFEPSSTSHSSLSVRSAAPMLNAAAQLQPDSASSIIVAPAVISTSNSSPSSPKVDEWSKSAGSPAPANEASSSSTADHHKHEKHKKKKKEKLGSHTMSLKKKGVSSLVQKWQKVKKEVEQEERANEQRQLAIRQQLEEWKKENS